MFKVVCGLISPILDAGKQFKVKPEKLCADEPARFHFNAETPRRRDQATDGHRLNTDCRTDIGGNRTIGDCGLPDSGTESRELGISMPPIQYHYGKFPPAELDWKQLIPLIGPANAALARYDGTLNAVPNPNVLLSPLATQEAVLSSKIEGTVTTIGSTGIRGRRPGSLPVARESGRYQGSPQLPASDDPCGWPTQGTAALSAGD